MTNQEARVLRLEALVVQLGTLAAQAGTRVRASEERQYALWQITGGGTPTTYSLSVSLPDLLGGVVSGATVELATTGGVVLQTTTSDGGGNASFSGIAPGSYLVGAYAAGRQGQTTNGSTNAVSIPATTSTSILMTPPGGNFCFDPQINRTLADPVYGTFTLPWIGFTGTPGTSSYFVNWQLTTTVNFGGYSGTGSCTPATGVPVTYLMQANIGNGGSVGLHVTYPSTGLPAGVGLNQCPASSGASRTVVVAGAGGGTPPPLRLGVSGLRLWGGSTGFITIS